MKNKIYNLIILNNGILGPNVYEYKIKTDRILQIEEVEKIIDDLGFGIDYVDFIYSEHDVEYNLNNETIII